MVCAKKQLRADEIYTKLVSRGKKMIAKGKNEETWFNRTVNGYSDNGKPHFLASFRLSKYNIGDKYQAQWDMV